MMETPPEENEALVRAICEAVSAASDASKPVIPNHQLIYDIDYLVMQANSGASFEQYFRWASVDEIHRIVSALEEVGLIDIAELTEQAKRVAFPNGLPSTGEEKSGLTDWSEAQEQELRDLFPAFEEQNGRITNVLAAFANRS